MIFKRYTSKLIRMCVLTWREVISCTTEHERENKQKTLAALAENDWITTTLTFYALYFGVHQWTQWRQWARRWRWRRVSARYWLSVLSVLPTVLRCTLLMFFFWSEKPEHTRSAPLPFVLLLTRPITSPCVYSFKVLIITRHRSSKPLEFTVSFSSQVIRELYGSLTPRAF